MNTKTIKTPKMGVEVELKEWITGEEGEEIDAPMTDMRFKINSMGQGAADLNMGEAIKKSTEKAVGIIVLKIDGETRDIWKRVREMRKTDYDFILKKVDRIARGLDLELPISKKEGGTD